MTFTSEEKYKNWKILKITDIPDCESKGIHLRHEQTGLEVFHLLNNDEENLFAFCFRTPPDDSCGEAHILEHSVLCGSQKYPLKDPFIRLINQSVKTFLNAITFPDKTLFPASSTVKADYFNLMSVYGDAVFFPNLSQEIFAQEAHRLEIDPDGNYSIQGVVYNEMKGNYSSFDSVAGDAAVRSLFPNTVYALDSGGDPLVIPNLTHKQLLDFHRKYYRSENCLIFLYGNIPTEEQLDFIDKNFISRLAEKQKADEKNNANTFCLDSILKKEIVKPFEKPVFVEETGPATGNKEIGATVLENWLLSPVWDMKSSMELVFLSELLCGHDGSPLTKALLDSGLGEDLSPSCGLLNSLSTSMFSIGLRGVASSNIQKVEQLILKTLNELCSNEIPQEDIQAALLSVNFSNREVKRSNGPFSLILLRRAMRGWNYGKDPAQMLLVRKNFAEIEKSIAQDKNYVPELIRKYFITNLHRSLVCINPDVNYTQERTKFEQTIITSKKQASTEEQIKQANEQLRSFQTKDESEAQGCLPHLKLSELFAKPKPIEVKKEIIKTEEGEIPLFVSTEATNGIVYADICFMADSIKIEDYPLIPLFTSLVTNCGWNGKNWAETAKLSAQCCGNFEAGVITSSAVETCPDEIYTNRDPLIFRIKMLTEKTEMSLNLVRDCLAGTDFSDLKRIQDIVNETRNDFDESIIPSGHSYSAMRAACRLNRSLATDEIWNGLRQLFTLHSLPEPKELSKHFVGMLTALKEGGAILHITSDSESLKTAVPLFMDFAEKAKLKPLKPAPKIPDEKFYALTEIKPDIIADDSDTEVFVTNCEVGYTASILPAAKWLTKESAAEAVLAHWLSTTVLWEELRTIGGAYGAFATTDPVEKTFVLSSYRDPSPLKTLDSFTACLKKARDIPFGKEELEKCIVGCYSKEIQPKSPSNRGFTGFLRILWGITEEDREQKIRLLFTLTPEDIKKALDNLINQSTRINVCIKNSDKDSRGKIIKLPN